MAISDLALSEEADLIATGGKDSKLKVWRMGGLLAQETTPLADFSHNGEVTCVAFAKATS